MRCIVSPQDTRGAVFAQWTVLIGTKMALAASMVLVADMVLAFLTETTNAFYLPLQKNILYKEFFFLIFL